MKALVAGHVTAFATLDALDMLRLALIARRFYKARRGPLLLEQPRWLVALLFYLIHAAEEVSPG